MRRIWFTSVYLAITMIALSHTERKLYSALRRNVGTIVSISELGRIISVKDGCANLRQTILRMRKKGLEIKNIRGQGYLITMPVTDLDVDHQFYAQDMQESLFSAMRKHADSVGFESQIAIMGVAIGAILHQLPEQDRKYFTKLLLKNINSAPKFSETVRLQ